MIPRLIALAYTAGLCALMLLPGEDSLAADVSGFFGGTDATDALGHVVLFGGMGAVWAWALRNVRAGCAVGVGAGLILETAQFFVPHRGAAFIDYAANIGGVVAFWIIYHILTKITTVHVTEKR